MVGAPEPTGSWNGDGAAKRGRLRRYSLPAALPPLAPVGAPALTGLSADEILTLLGKPDFRRVEPPTELWQYRSAACVLDVFLYRDASGARVIHAETRERGLIRAKTGRCAGDALHRHIRPTRL